jgi:6-pyruvoyltetrahydropterin/6-carboxytetrahydropterin synthase
MSKVTMIEEYAFSAAHHLPGFPDGDRDRGMHGHTWTVAIHVEVELGDNGFAFDHALLDTVADDVLVIIESKVLNTIFGLEDGLNETIAAWLGRSFGWSLARHCGTRAKLRRLILGQLGSGKCRRLVNHKTVWEVE